MGLFKRSITADPGWRGAPELLARMPEIDEIANRWLSDAGWTYEELRPHIIASASGVVTIIPLQPPICAPT
jgi:hypothetical protein